MWSERHEQAGSEDPGHGLSVVGQRGHEPPELPSPLSQHSAVALGEHRVRYSIPVFGEGLAKREDHLPEIGAGWLPMHMDDGPGSRSDVEVARIHVSGVDLRIRD